MCVSSYVLGYRATSHNLHPVPPHNHDQIPGMKTVFDLNHLSGKERTFLLNVQCKRNFHKELRD